MDAWVSGLNQLPAKEPTAITRSVGSNPTASAKVIRKADDLFVVMWLSKDTRETTIVNYVKGE